MNGDRHDLLTVTQLDWLRRLGEWGEARVSSRNSVEDKTISGASAHAFAVRGLTVDVPDRGRIHVVRLSDAGAAAVEANRAHLPVPPWETEAAARGRAAAEKLRVQAIEELQAVLDDTTGTTHNDHVGREFARHQIDRLRAVGEEQHHDQDQ